MKSPLKIRRLEALREINNSPEVLCLKAEIAERHRQIRALTQDAEDLSNAVPHRLRTEFLQIPGTDTWMSVDLTDLTPDGIILDPWKGCRLLTNGSGDVYQSMERWQPMFIASSMSEALKIVRERYKAQDWVFLPCEWEAVNQIRITDWGDLS